MGSPAPLVLWHEILQRTNNLLTYFEVDVKFEYWNCNFCTCQFVLQYINIYTMMRSNDISKIKRGGTLKHRQDEVVEWLRRWTANPLGFPRAGSNPILVDHFLSVYSAFKS